MLNCAFSVRFIFVLCVQFRNGNLNIFFILKVIVKVTSVWNYDQLPDSNEEYSKNLVSKIIY